MTRFDQVFEIVQAMRTSHPEVARLLALISEHTEATKKSIEAVIKSIEAKAKKEKADEDNLKALKETLK